MEINHDGADFKAPWEDSLIIAVRDLQWRKSLERLLTGKLSALPDPLFKLGGTAENALGDVGIAVNSRHYLLEFKRDAKQTFDEVDKPLVKIMKQVHGSADSKHRDRFIKISRRGHHFVFSEKAPGQQPKVAGVAKEAAIIIQTSPYFDEAAKMTKTGELSAATEIVELLYPAGKTGSGLLANEMLAYIKVLVEAHAKSEGDDGQVYPFKGVVLNDRGFFWPMNNLADLSELQIILTGRTDSELVKAATIEHSKMSKILKDIAAGTKKVAAKSATKKLPQ